MELYRGTQFTTFVNCILKDGTIEPLPWRFRFLFPTQQETASFLKNIQGKINYVHSSLLDFISDFIQ